MKIEDLIKENNDLDIKEHLLDNKSMVYFLCDINDEIVYVGKTCTLNGRISHHKKRFFIKSVYYIKCTKDIINELEGKLIKKTNAKHNIQLSNHEAIHRDKGINVNLYQACIGTRMQMQDIALLAGIERSRFSKILNKKLQPTLDEKRKLSQILRVPQKKLFVKE